MVRTTGFAATTLAVLLGVSTVANAQGGFGPPELTTVKVRDNVYMIRNASSGNVTMLVNEAGVILIDDKFPQDHDGIMEHVREISDAPVRYVINTHMHPDHAGGNPAMQAIGADIVASANARRIMTERNQAGLPAITLNDSMQIYLGDLEIELHWFGRGHTDGDVMVYLPQERLLIAGDLFALYDTYQPVVDYSAGGSAREWPGTLERALRLDFDTVIPGHSGLTDRATMEGYQAFLERQNAMVLEMNAARRSREDIQAVLASEFNWGNLAMSIGLDGILAELR